MSDSNVTQGVVESKIQSQPITCAGGCKHRHFAKWRVALYSPIALVAGGLAALAAYPDLADYVSPLIGQTNLHYCCDANGACCTKGADCCLDSRIDAGTGSGSLATMTANDCCQIQGAKCCLESAACCVHSAVRTSVNDDSAMSESVSADALSGDNVVRTENSAE